VQSSPPVEQERATPQVWPRRAHTQPLARRGQQSGHRVRCRRPHNRPRSGLTAEASPPRVEAGGPGHTEWRAPSSSITGGRQPPAAQRRSRVYLHDPTEARSVHGRARSREGGQHDRGTHRRNGDPVTPTRSAQASAFHDKQARSALRKHRFCWSPPGHPSPCGVR
jgi:hypothetical protein